jgi:hypothetical protein
MATSYDEKALRLKVREMYNKDIPLAVIKDSLKITSILVYSSREEIPKKINELEFFVVK